MEKIEIVNGEQYRRVLGVGDIHGEYDRLMAALEKAGFDKEQDLLLCTGDLIDRGEQNIECLELVGEPWFKTVRGNHDEMLVRSLAGEELWIENWKGNGGYWYYYLNREDQMYVHDLAAKVAELPYIIELHLFGKKYIISHADYPHDEYIAEHTDWFNCIWSRDRIDSLIGGAPMESARIKGADLFFCGHTALASIAKVSNVVWMDTGVVFDKSKDFSFFCLKQS